MDATHTDATHSDTAPGDETPAAGKRWSGPLFIVGMPRSGTKLLRGLLGQHPRVRIPDIETDFFPFLVRWVRAHGSPVTTRAFQDLFETLQHAAYFRLRRNPWPFLWSEWRECCAQRFDASGLFEGFIRYETATSRDSGVIWGDKSPAYVRQMEVLLGHFPQARIVHIVRDVRDYCVSIRKAWNKDVRRAAFQWGRDVAAAHATCRANARRCFELRYEDLLCEPDVQLRRLTAFLDLDFIDAMIRLDRPVENVGDAAGKIEIVRDNLQKFSQRLTEEEILAIEGLAFETMHALQYKPVCARRQVGLTALEQRWLRLKDGMNLLKRDARKRGVLSALRVRASQTFMTH